MGRNNELSLTPLYDDKALTEAVRRSNTLTGVLRYLGIRPSSSRIEIAARQIKRKGLDSSHFLYQGQRYTQDILTRAVAAGHNWQDVLRFLGLRPGGGGIYSHIKQRVEKFGIDTKHFTGSGWNKGKPSNKKLPPEAILVRQSPLEPKEKTYLLRRALLESGIPHICSVCGLSPVWMGKPLEIQIDHINGDRWDHCKENLRFLCPNCHTQTETYGNKRRGTED